MTPFPAYRGDSPKKRVLAISGSRADYGLLEWPVKVLRESFDVEFERLICYDPANAFTKADWLMSKKTWQPDCLLILGDRWEILQAAIAAHLRRVPIAHIGGGDVTLGSYDDAMRDCISRLATWHFPTSDKAADRLCGTSGYEGCEHGYPASSVHMIGNIAIDYIRHGDWKRERPIDEPYVVVSYQAETIDDDGDNIHELFEQLGGKKCVFILPNMDTGRDKIEALIRGFAAKEDAIMESLPHAEFLNLLYYCDEFIGNSSAMLYEAPELNVKCRMIGKRQAGRVKPTGDGKASERIREVLCRCL